MGKSVKQFCGLDSFNKKPDGTEWKHEQIYRTVIAAIGLDTCIKYLPADKERIQRALKQDEHLNTIPLKEWDSKHPQFTREFVRVGISVISLSDTVCTLKEAARMYAQMK